MGDKITRAAQAADLSRAKLLKEALRRGMPRLSQPSESSLNSDAPEIQETYLELYRDISDQERTETLSSALYRIAEKASSAVDLQSLYAGIHNIVGELMYARNLYIALFGPVTLLISFPYFVDVQDPSPEPRTP